MKKGWSIENHKFFKEFNDHVFTILLSFKSLEMQFELKISKYLKQEMIKMFFEDFNYNKESNRKPKISKREKESKKYIEFVDD